MKGAWYGETSCEMKERKEERKKEKNEPENSQVTETCW